MHVRVASNTEFDLDSDQDFDLNIDAEGHFLLQVQSPGTYHVFRTSKFGKPSWHDEAQASAASFGGGMNAEENAAWRRTPDCSFEVVDGVPNEVKLHWVNGMERGVALAC